MAKYRKKPVEIEAIKFDHNYSEIADFVPHSMLTYNTLTHRVWINTLEGTMEAQIGDWIIRGIKGEFYPCKPDIFAATYDPVAPPSAEPERREK